MEKPIVTEIKTDSLRFTIFNLFEIVFAYAIIFGVARLTNQFLGWDLEIFIILACMYPLKIAIAFAARKHLLYSLIAYACLAIAVVAWPIYKDWDNQHVTWFGLFICIPIMLLCVPTVTFFLDVADPKKPSARFLIWRSLVEIVVIFPPWLFVSSFIGLFLGGWWI